MKSKQVLDVQQMQHLQELEMKLDYNTLFKYVKFEDSDWLLKPSSDLDIIGISCRYIPAYTLQDVLDALPKELKPAKRRYWLRMDLSDGCVYYYYEDSSLVEQRVILFNGGEDIDLLEAAYRMLCWVLTNKYIQEYEQKNRNTRRK